MYCIILFTLKLYVITVADAWYHRIYSRGTTVADPWDHRIYYGTVMKWCQIHDARILSKA